MSDLDSRFASVGVAKSSFILDPKFKEPPRNLAVELPEYTVAFAVELQAAHFAVDSMQLTREWKHVLTVKEEYLVAHPHLRTVVPAVFWPNFLDHLQTCPLVRRVVTAMIVLVHQNAEVERDLGFLKRIRDITLNKLADERYDSRCRIMVSDEPDEKERGKRLTGFLAGVADVWSQMRRRQQCPAEKRVSPGPQGSMPQRAPKRLCGFNRQNQKPVEFVGEDVSGDAESTELDPGQLCAFLG